RDRRRDRRRRRRARAHGRRDLRRRCARHEPGGAAHGGRLQRAPTARDVGQRRPRLAAARPRRRRASAADRLRDAAPGRDGGPSARRRDVRGRERARADGGRRGSASRAGRRPARAAHGRGARRRAATGGARPDASGGGRGMTAPLEIDGAVLDRSRLDALVAAATRDADALGLGPGDGIAVAAGDPLGTVVAAAVAAAGGAAIVHTWQPLAELAREPHRRWARLWSTGGDAIAVAPAARRADAPELPAEAGALLWTSGSSGAPRMAVLPRSGLVQQAQATAE